MQFLSNVSSFTQRNGRYSDREVSKSVIKSELNFIQKNIDFFDVLLPILIASKQLFVLLIHHKLESVFVTEMCVSLVKRESETACE